MTDQKTPPADGADKGTQDPAVSGSAGQSQTQSTEAPLNIPEKFKGQTTEQIAKSYVELEKKLGDQSKTIEESKKVQEQMDTVLRAIYSDPETYRTVENAVKKYGSGGIIPETRKTEKGDEEAGDTQTSSQIADLRRSQENQILGNFYTKYGYNGLEDKEKKDSMTRLGMALAEIVDPGGKKPIKEILTSISLDKLPRFLEHAHFIANKEQIVEREKRKALLDKQTNEEATIGSFSASSGQGASEGVKLSNREREIAQKMGISEEAYAKRKAEILKENAL